VPCYLFTWHAYGTWMPDRKRGYVKKQTILPQSLEAAAEYRKRQKEPAACFSPEIQQQLIDELRKTATHRRFRLHAVATDKTHVHVLLSWADERPFEELRRGTRESLTRRLRQREKRTWLSHRGSRKRLRERAHFDQLMNRYLPSHRGRCWFEPR